MTAEKLQMDLNASILKHVSMIKPWIPKRAVIAVGEYPAEILKNFETAAKDSYVQTLFARKPRQGGRSQTVKPIALEIDKKADTHYWFNVQKHLSEKGDFSEKLNRGLSDKVESAFVVAATGEGAGSFLLPEVVAELKERNLESVAFAILPSQIQPPDAFFNSLWSMSACVRKGIVQILVDRDGLEDYVGVDRKGAVLKGNGVLGYLLDLALAKESFVQELNELARSYNVKAFTPLAATGASLRVHGSLENVLVAASLEPFIAFDLSTATVLYVLVRMPSKLMGKLTQSHIEFTVNKWFKDKANLKAVRVSEPVYVDDGSDRIDILMLVGGFDLSEMANNIDKQVKEIVDFAVKKENIKEKEWSGVVRKLLA